MILLSVILLPVILLPVILLPVILWCKGFSGAGDLDVKVQIVAYIASSSISICRACSPRSSFQTNRALRMWSFWRVKTAFMLFL